MDVLGQSIQAALLFLPNSLHATCSAGPQRRLHRMSWHPTASICLLPLSSNCGL